MRRSDDRATGLLILRVAAAIAVIILGLISLGHLLRLLFGWAFIVHETIVPLWPSVVVVVVFAFVAVMLGGAARIDRVRGGDLDDTKGRR